MNDHDQDRVELDTTPLAVLSLAPALAPDPPSPGSFVVGKVHSLLPFNWNKLISSL